MAEDGWIEAKPSGGELAYVAGGHWLISAAPALDRQLHALERAPAPRRRTPARPHRLRPARSARYGRRLADAAAEGGARAARRRRLARQSRGALRPAAGTGREVRAREGAEAASPPGPARSSSWLRSAPGRSPFCATPSAASAFSARWRLPAAAPSPIRGGCGRSPSSARCSAPGRRRCRSSGCCPFSSAWCSPIRARRN